MSFIKYLTGILFMMLLLNCNYSMTEKDKHPDWDSFPKLAGSGFKMDSINDSILNLKYDSDYYYAANGKFLFVYNRDFKRVWKEKSDLYNVEVDEKKNIYVYNNEEVYKYAFPWSRREKVEVINGYKIADSIRATLGNLQDDLTHDSIKEKRIENIKLEILDRKIRSNYISCYSFEDSGYILFSYKGKEYGLYDYELKKYYENKKGLKPFWAKNIAQTETNLKLNDKAVLGNGSSGNHFFFSFYPYGYAYYRLKTGKNSMDFKYYNNNLDQRNLMQWKNPFNNKIILRRYYDNSRSTIYLVSNT
ncbi:hypothetical protein CEY12_05850 [Chryseobacterium sp. T16E-39]|uniref:hypothetical protein n=1 Tax=Chryseobacterium sp. T16E-39 TaxID=2015076 RepID=UPI000B5B18B5|nr:hypothetical protein [Chryseobacterium sp. T16E-39]ASK29655.1 hypothetical protein CEY12_05850 [Chryseobacterium sp. T16E-39]